MLCTDTKNLLGCCTTPLFDCKWLAYIERNVCCAITMYLLIGREGGGTAVEALKLLQSSIHAFQISGTLKLGFLPSNLVNIPPKKWCMILHPKWLYYICHPPWTHWDSILVERDLLNATIWALSKEKCRLQWENQQQKRTDGIRVIDPKLRACVSGWRWVVFPLQWCRNWGCCSDKIQFNELICLSKGIIVREFIKLYVCMHTAPIYITQKLVY